MLNYYLYLVTKENKQKTKQSPGNEIPLFHVLDVVGLHWGCCSAQLGTLCRRAETSHPQLFSSWWSGPENGQKWVFFGGGGISCRYQIQTTFAAITMCLSQLQPYPVSPSCQEMPLRFGRGTEEALKCHALCSWPLESLLCPALWWQKSTDSSEIPPHFALA